MISQLAPLVGGKGGGRPDMAQGGGPEVAAIPAVITAFTELITTHLNVQA